MSCAQSKRIYSKELFLVFTLALLIFTVSSTPAQEEQKALPDKKAEEQSEAIYEPGAALLEIFKADSIDKVSDLVPVIRTLWKRDLACTWLARSWEQRENPWRISDNYRGAFLFPERARELGATPGFEYQAPYVARFSFYYEAKESGKYGFNIWHGRNTCRLVIGGSVVAEDSPKSSTTQGVCKLEKGFHRVEFWLISNIDSNDRNDPYFEIKVLSPDAFDAELITKDKLLMKSADSPKS